MAAVIAPAPTPRPAEPGRAPRPALRVIPGGGEAALRRRRPASVYRRRRVGAVLVLTSMAVLVGLAAVGVRSLIAPGGAAAGSAPRAAVPAVATVPSPSERTGAVSAGAGGWSPGRVHVVVPGDTLWSIAAELDPGADPRPLVDALAERTGGTTLQVGQRIPLDGLADRG